MKVIAGEHKGSQGRVLQVILKKDRVLIEGVNKVTKHVKPSAQSPQGGVVKKEAPIHVSNVALINKEGSFARTGYRFEGDKKVRYCKKTKEEI